MKKILIELRELLSKEEIDINKCLGLIDSYFVFKKKLPTPDEIFYHANKITCKTQFTEWFYLNYSSKI